MVFVPINLSTAIICEQSGQEVNTFSLLFKAKTACPYSSLSFFRCAEIASVIKNGHYYYCWREYAPPMSSLGDNVAYKFAQKGLIIYVLTKPPIHLPLTISRDLLQANILERIHFRYFSTSEEVIKWCHEAHCIRQKPTVLLVSIKDFIQSDNIESLSLCAALLDAMTYFSEVLATEQLYLLSVVIIDLNSFIPHLLTFFNLSWLVTMKYHLLQLSPFQTDGRSTFSISLDHDTAFEDIQKIFLK